MHLCYSCDKLKFYLSIYLSIYLSNNAQLVIEEDTIIPEVRGVDLSRVCTHMYWEQD